jgi:dipeptidyl aminopeptidase/acylaminoacyl peptidase
MSEGACGPDIVRRQVLIEAFRISPDGESIVFVRRHVDGIEYRSHLWVVPYGGGRPRQLTNGALRDSSPTFSPDGRQLAFVRTPAGADHGQVWIVPLAGGQPEQVTTLPHGAGGVSWSPDGRMLAVSASSDDVPFIVGPFEKGKAPRARHMTRLDWRDDESGHRDRRTHLFIVKPRPGARPRQVTRGDYDVEHATWSPDSATIAFTTDMRPERDIDPRSSIWAVGVDDGEPRELAALGGNASFPAYSPDGRWLAFLGQGVEQPTDYEPWLIWLMPAAGGTPRPLMEGRDLSVGAWTWSDLVLTDSSASVVWIDDESLACLIAVRGRCHPYRLELAGGLPRPMVGEDRLLASALDAHSGRVAIAAGIDGQAGELYALEDGRLRRLTRDGAAWQRRCPRPPVVELDIPGPAGPINTWLASPPDAGDEPLPLVLQFHGGPTGAYGAGSNLDVMLLTAAGYRVALPNIRGSTGFGYEWAAALDGRWGDVDVEDTVAVIDHLVERGLVDRGRIGAIGLSYAGFLVQYLVGATDLLAAAVAENGVANQVAAWGNCYFGTYWNRRHNLGDPLSEVGMRKLWRSSPLSNVANIRTPLLILQAEEDRICPPADNEQLFTALRVLGRTVEYVLYPEEHHEMKTHGRPDRRIDRHERILDWFERYL